MRIRKRQVPLPLSLLSPVPLSDLHLFVYHPSAPEVPKPSVVQLQVQQREAPHHELLRGDDTTAPSEPYDDQSQPSVHHPRRRYDQKHHHESHDRTPSSSSRGRSDESGLILTDEKLHIEGEERAVEDHHQNHERKRQDVLKISTTHGHRDHDITSTSSKQWSKISSAAAEKTAADYDTGSVTITPDHQVCQNEWWCREEKVIPFKKRRGSSTRCFLATTPTTGTTNSELSKDHLIISDKEEENNENSKQIKVMMSDSRAICKASSNIFNSDRGITTLTLSSASTVYENVEGDDDELEDSKDVDSDDSGKGDRLKSTTERMMTDHGSTRVETVGVTKLQLGKKRSGTSSGSSSGIMEGSRCSRVNGRKWRCSRPTFVGYSLCQHHLGKGSLGVQSGYISRPKARVQKRIIKKNHIKMDKHMSSSSLSKSTALSDTTTDWNKEMEKLKYTKKSKKCKIGMGKPVKLGMVKARSLSSLLHQIDNATISVPPPQYI